MPCTRSTAIIATLSGATLCASAWADPLTLAPGAWSANGAWLVAPGTASTPGGEYGGHASASIGVAEPAASIISGSFLPASLTIPVGPSMYVAGTSSGVTVLTTGGAATASSLTPSGSGWYSIGHVSSPLMDPFTAGFGSLTDGPTPVIVPLPTGVWLGAAGLAGLGVLRAARRR